MLISAPGLTDQTEANSSDFGNEKDSILCKRVQEKRDRNKDLFIKHESFHSRDNNVTCHCFKHYNSLLLPVDLSEWLKPNE